MVRISSSLWPVSCIVLVQLRNCLCWLILLPRFSSRWFFCFRTYRVGQPIASKIVIPGVHYTVTFSVQDRLNKQLSRSSLVTFVKLATLWKWLTLLVQSSRIAFSALLPPIKEQWSQVFPQHNQGRPFNVILGVMPTNLAILTIRSRRGYQNCNVHVRQCFPIGYMGVTIWDGQNIETNLCRIPVSVTVDISRYPTEPLERYTGYKLCTLVQRKNTAPKVRVHLVLDLLEACLAIKKSSPSEPHYSCMCWGSMKHWGQCFLVGEAAQRVSGTLPYWFDCVSVDTCWYAH